MHAHNVPFIYMGMLEFAWKLIIYAPDLKPIHTSKESLIGKYCVAVVDKISY